MRPPMQEDGACRSPHVQIPKIPPMIRKSLVWQFQVVVVSKSAYKQR
jgi:hypothetical protein